MSVSTPTAAEEGTKTDNQLKMTIPEHPARDGM